MYQKVFLVSVLMVSCMAAPQFGGAIVGGPLGIANPLGIAGPLGIANPVGIAGPLGIANPVGIAGPLGIGNPLGYANPLGIASPLRIASPLGTAFGATGLGGVPTGFQAAVPAFQPAIPAALPARIGVPAVGITAPAVIPHEVHHHPQYHFKYGVNDPHTGDHKSQEEARDGDVVRGSYSLVEPDGTLRRVDYTADSHTGFNAVVSRTGVANHPQIQAVQPIIAAAPRPVLPLTTGFA